MLLFPGLPRLGLLKLYVPRVATAELPHDHIGIVYGLLRSLLVLQVQRHRLYGLRPPNYWHMRVGGLLLDRCPRAYL